MCRGQHLMTAPAPCGCLDAACFVPKPRPLGFGWDPFWSQSLARWPPCWCCSATQATWDCMAVVSISSIALRRQELHRPHECRRLGHMAADLPLKLLLITCAGVGNRDQSRLIAYLLEENRVFHEVQSNKRLRLSDDQRRRLGPRASHLDDDYSTRSPESSRPTRSRGGIVN